MPRSRAERLPVLILLLVLTAAPVAGAEGPGTLVRGSVHIKERSLFSGLRDREDRSGVVVYLTGFAQPGQPEPATLSQRGERFDPKLLPIVAGQSVLFPNFDRLYHNVFSVSPVKNFDLGQYRSTDPPRSVTFESPGLVPVFCNIHPHMISYVVVLENPAYAVTGADGKFEITGAPPGPVTVNAWIPGAGRVSQDLTLAEGAASEVELELIASERIAPHTRKDGSAYPRPGTEHYQ
ncbi:MAG TPA: carboxypeptidase regulatory-like domain-containing protein [Myxococcota bacterium]